MSGDDSSMAIHHGTETEEDRETRQMRESGCEPLEHVGRIDVRITMGQEVRVDKFCTACDMDVEGWSYDPPVAEIEIELEDGQTERFTRREVE